MSTRYRVAEDFAAVHYPADPVSLRVVRDNHGISKLTPEEQAKVRFKTVEPGGDCSDMPEPALSIYLERGWVVKTSESGKDAK